MFVSSCFVRNGVSKLDKAVNGQKSASMGITTMTREWIFILLILFVTLSIAISKLYINYELVNKQLYSKQDDESGTNILSHLYDIPNLMSIPDLSKSVVKQLAVTSTKFINTTNQCEKAITGTMIKVSTKYGWLIKALLSGLVMTAFSWFIIYMDSRIPGIDPSSPFQIFQRKKYRIQVGHISLNYLIGALVGLLVFISNYFD